VSLLIIFLCCLSFGITFKLTILAFILAILVGFLYLIGYLFYYRAFEIGNLSSVSSIIAINSVFTAIISYFFFGSRLSFHQYCGVALVAIATIIIIIDIKDLQNMNFKLVKGLKEVLLASIIFGCLTWPITIYLTARFDWLFINLIIKASAIAFAVIIFKFFQFPLKLKQHSPKKLLPLIFIGILDIIALLSVNYGLIKGNPIIVAPLGNSVALITVILAVIFLKEKIPLYKWIAIGGTAIGIILISI